MPQTLARIGAALSRWVADGVSRGEPAPGDAPRLDITVTRLRVRGQCFTVVLLPDHRGYVATVPALPACLAFGDTAAQALARLRCQVRAYLTEAERQGEPLLEEGTPAQVIVATLDVSP